MTTLSNIAAEINDPKAKSDAYLGFLEGAVRTQNVSSLMEFVEHRKSLFITCCTQALLVTCYTLIYFALL
jgi:hypothetical protein